MLVQLSRHSNDRNLQHTATLSSLFLADLTMPNRQVAPYHGRRTTEPRESGPRALASARCHGLSVYPVCVCNKVSVVHTRPNGLFTLSCCDLLVPWAHTGVDRVVLPTGGIT